ncbi:MAG TPA: virulence factor [Baekduia sp.]|nr:virulence factor [Baekduia sp.]
MATYRVLSWDGIPAQVKAKAPGSRAVSVQLDQWFTEHVDRVAMHNGQFGTDAYLEQWKWSADSEREGEPADVAAAVAAELEAAWRPLRERWEQGADVLDERAT